jgi:diguanylate cyclase (GGDEF)-like protein
MSRPQGSASLQLRLRDGPPHTGSSSAYGLLVENDSVLWGCGSEICLYADGTTTVFGPSSGLPAGSWRGIIREGNGDLWVQSVEGRVAVFRKETARFQLADLPELAGFGPRGLIKVDSGGHIIIPVGDGVAIRQDGRWQLVGRAAGLRGPVYAVLQDREGTLWLGLGGHGLAKWLGYGQWEYFNSDSGLGSDLAYGVTPAGNGAYWAATDAGLFLGRQTSTGWNWKRQATLGDLPIHSVQPDGHGKVWLGTEGKGAVRMDLKTGGVEWFGPKQGLNAQSPYTIMIDRQNRIWAASMTGLFVADGSTLRFRAADGLPSAIFCLAVIEAPNGDIWAGTRDGLFQLSGGQWNRFSTANGLSNDEVLSLAAGTNGDIWVGYQYGNQIDRIHATGNGLTVAHEKNRKDDSRGTTYFLGFDARGRLWAGTNRGVDVRNGNVRDESADEARARYGVAWDHYDHHDGLVWDDCDLNGFRANPDGTVWIGTSGGLALFTPQDAASLQGPPVAILTKLTLGKQSVDTGASISVEHTANSLTARFSALTFARENAVRFRYRLAPLFRDWRETRERELEFPGLPPDSYRLEVQARDGWGRWGTESAAFSFEVRAPWWRSWWCITLCSILPLGLVAGTLRLRGNAMRRREFDLLRLVDERTVELKQATSQLRAANQNLVQLSMLDGLTGIPNRRAFDATMGKEWERARRSGAPLSVIMADIDYFKRLNDSAGHQAGDECLRLVAQALSETGKRGADCVARYGGEEFALLLPGIDKAQAAALAETARRSVENLEFPHPDSPTGNGVTISLGVATAIGANFTSIHALVGAADNALYTAKRQGRNKVAGFGGTYAPDEDTVAYALHHIGEAQSLVRDSVTQAS